MNTSTQSILNANQAVARIAYKTNEVFPIYPITPASEMSELVEQWCAEKKENSFGNIPSVFQMQSEAGVAGAMHGALQTGALSSTFTASQGLLLMLPNMYRIAGELTSNVIHVATRSMATHALSVFGDHSDIMGVRQSGYAMLGSASVQEAQDFALIAQTATLESHIPFVHFFDGFRTSHEINKIDLILDETIQFMMDLKGAENHRSRALTPNKPVIRGTAQQSDVFFQSREAINPFYDACPDIVQKHMDMFAALTGRSYQLFDYVGDPKAEQIIISMASSTETIEATIKHLNNTGEKFGLIKVRLFRPFSTKHLIDALPKSVTSIAVLDRTKEAGSSGEPLYLDVLQSLSEAFQNNKIKSLPKLVGGRYGLSSKVFNPGMVQAIFNNLKQDYPKNNFTIGIHDDVTNLSLEYSSNLQIENNTYQAIFYQKKNKTTTESFTNTLKLIAKQQNTYVQGYIDCDYKKSNTINMAHLRINQTPIKEPYLINQADFIGCQYTDFTAYNHIIDLLKHKGTLLVHTPLKSKAFWQSLSIKTQHQIREKEVNLFIFDCDELLQLNVLKDHHLSILHACFLALRKEPTYEELSDYIYNVGTSKPTHTKDVQHRFDSVFNSSLLGQLLANKGNDVPVSLLPADGTYPSDTSQYNPIQQSTSIPSWQPDMCTQCGACSMACPQGALRIKVYDHTHLEKSPSSFKHVKSTETDWDVDLLNYTIQIHTDQCNSCNHCVDACTSKALTMVNRSTREASEKQNWTYFETIPEFDREKINPTKINQQQLQEPLFKYSIGVEGCGEAPYLKLMSQLFGDRLLVANATGASSIFGGALPTTPWSKNDKGRGPAWSNSLFEDNAEFGLGYRLSLDQQEQQAKNLLLKFEDQLDSQLVRDILTAKQTTEVEINQQRSRITRLKMCLKALNSSEAKQLLNMTDHLVKKSVWIVGGDGWAYDIGFGGLDHVVASGKNVNILILDNEVYDNTGGQASKATPFGSEAKFTFQGKQKQKKDLGLFAMNYDHVYVASVAIGANQEQTLKAFNEAESFEGPSIIIAYSHSASHGIDMKHPSKYHKAAVQSGQWLLYRNDPRRATKHLSTLQLDSEVPSVPIQDYLKLEARFSKLFRKNKNAFRNVIRDIQSQVDTRFNRYLQMSSNQISRTKWLQNHKIKQQLTYKK